MLLLIVLNPRLALGENALALSIEIDAEATGGAGPMTAMGHGEKNSQRAYVFRIDPDSCRKRAVPALTFSATSRPPGIREKSRLPAVRPFNEASRPTP